MDRTILSLFDYSGAWPKPYLDAGYEVIQVDLKHGDDSWELDALSPPVIAALVREEVEALRDDEQWEEDATKEESGRDRIQELADMANE